MVAQLMGRRSAKGATPATVALTQARITHTLHPYEHDPRAASFGLEAAEALGVEPARVFKTLLANVEDAGRQRLVVGIVPVTGQLDLKALARALGHAKAAMAAPADAERATGYVTGGISPIGQKRQHPTVLDESALGWETVFVSAGRRGLDVELSPDDLRDLTNATVAAIGR